MFKGNFFRSFKLTEEYAEWVESQKEQQAAKNKSKGCVIL